MSKPQKVEQLYFISPTQEEINAKRIEELQQSLHKIRKGAYANIGELRKDISEMKNMFEHMMHVICQTKSE